MKLNVQIWIENLMNYKSFYSSTSTNFSVEASLDAFTNNLEIAILENNENQINNDNFTISKLKQVIQAAELLSIGFSEKDLNKTQNSILFLQKSLNCMTKECIQQVHEIFIHYGTYQILVSIFNLNTISLDEKTSNIFTSIIIDNIIELSLLIILQITQISRIAINTLISQNFIQVFLLNEEYLSTLSKKMGLYALSNIILEMPDITFNAFYNGIWNKLKQTNDINVQKSGYGKIFYIIDEESSNDSLQTSVFHLLNVFCYRISMLDQLNEVSWSLTNEIMEKVYGANNYFYVHHSTQKSRRELFYAVYRLCCVYPIVTQAIFVDQVKIQPFINNFRSSHEEDVEFAINFFCLLYHESQVLEIQIAILKLVPWERLLVRIENQHLSWIPRFFRAVEEMSINQASINEFWGNGVYSKLISYSNFDLNSRVEICKMFMNILSKSTSWISADEYEKFIQSGVIHIFIALLDSEEDIVEEILDFLHTVNQKLALINKVNIICQEYEKYDAVSILQDVQDFPEKSYILCKELGLIN